MIKSFSSQNGKLLIYIMYIIKHLDFIINSHGCNVCIDNITNSWKILNFLFRVHDKKEPNDNGPRESISESQSRLCRSSTYEWLSPSSALLFSSPWLFCETVYFFFVFTFIYMQPTPDTHNRDLTWNSSFKFTDNLLNAYYFWVQTASLSGSLWYFLQSRGTSWKREQGEHLIKMTSTSGFLLLARTQVWWHVFGVILM